MPGMRRLALLFSVLLAPAMAAAGCGGPNGDRGPSANSGSRLSLVAYSTPKEAYEKLIPRFALTQAASGVSFDQSYGASGEQSRAVEAGLPADILALSLAPDIDRLVEPGIVAKDWADDPYDGFVTNSVVVLAVRKGNPKNIRTWADLVKPGVEVITPNPFTSGGAKWNLMAAYGARIEQGASPEEALDYLRKLLKHTPVQDKSAREALQTFNGGKGDVLIAYENEAITGQAKGVALDYVVPEETILIQNPIAVTAKSKNPDKAQAFVDYLRSKPAQTVFGEAGYRSVRPELVDAKKYPRPAKLFEITKLGGWPKVNDEFFDPETGSVAEIERDLGVSTAK
jgi:sulfate/thiosulfate transport system substrate-binding protein